MRPDVVWFDEPLDPYVLDAAWNIADGCDVLLVVGASLQVQPVAGIPWRAAYKGVKVIEINPEPEMSIRAAANPKRPNPLKTISTDQGTRIDVSVAMEWLKAKGRYLPITNVWSQSDIRLETTRFDRLDTLDGALQARYRSLCNEGRREELDAVLAEAKIQTAQGWAGPFIDMTEQEFQDENKLLTLARVLELPAELLVLRVKETLAHESLRSIESALKQVTQKV